MHAGRSLLQSLKSKRFVPLAAFAAAIVNAAPVWAATCTDIAGMPFPDTTITLTQTYVAGETVSGSTKAPVDLCRVAGTIMPGPRSNVRFEVWIPTEWNGKYQQVGNGGFAGSIPLGAIANAASRHHAAAGADDGTSGPSPGAPAFIGNRGWRTVAAAPA